MPTSFIFVAASQPFASAATPIDTSLEADLYPWWHRDHDASFFVVATADAGAGTDGTGAADEAGLDGGDALAAEDGD
ncbi:MAG: hypothetical protein WBY94_02975, partial [Polyangiaceae bacterium]